MLSDFVNNSGYYNPGYDRYHCFPEFHIAVKLMPEYPVCPDYRSADSSHAVPVQGYSSDLFIDDTGGHLTEISVLR
jgi:hypothetical protein